MTTSCATTVLKQPIRAYAVYQTQCTAFVKSMRSTPCLQDVCRLADWCTSRSPPELSMVSMRVLFIPQGIGAYDIPLELPLTACSQCDGHRQCSSCTFDKACTHMKAHRASTSYGTSAAITGHPVTKKKASGDSSCKALHAAHRMPTSRGVALQVQPWPRGLHSDGVVPGCARWLVTV